MPPNKKKTIKHVKAWAIVENGKMQREFMYRGQMGIFCHKMCAEELTFGNVKIIPVLISPITQVKK